MPQEMVDFTAKIRLFKTSSDWSTSPADACPAADPCPAVAPCPVKQKRQQSTQNEGQLESRQLLFPHRRHHPWRPAAAHAYRAPTHQTLPAPTRPRRWMPSTACRCSSRQPTWRRSHPRWRATHHARRRAHARRGAHARRRTAHHRRAGHCPGTKAVSASHAPELALGC